MICLVSICSGVVWQQDTPWLLWLCAGTDGIWRGLTTVVIFAYLQRLMPSADRRLPALFLAAGGLGQGLASLVPLLCWSYFADGNAAAKAMCWIAFACISLALFGLDRMGEQ